MQNSIRHGILVVFLLTTLVACDNQQSQLDRMLEIGEVKMVTIYSPTTYFIDADSETGFEYELARMFATDLGLKLKIIIADNKAEMVNILMRGEADIAVGLIKQTFSENNNLIAGPEYYHVTQQVIYKRGFDRPDSLDDLSPYQLHIAQGGIKPEKLLGLKQQYTEFSWKLHPDASSSGIIDLIENDQIAYAGVYSNELLLAQQTYPELRAAFDILEPTPLSWFVRNTPDKSLLAKIESFFIEIEQKEGLSELIEYFFGPVQKFDYVDQRQFISRFESRFTQFESLFKATAKENDIDWRMLAAMSYQESHWNARARSPTGVRGLMMLTLDTAKQVGVSDRLDPGQSIQGGARYFNIMLKKIPQQIQGPDRIWFALAAYNIGFGHLEDARVITQKQGGNPNKWVDVKNHLPNLQNNQWYKQTRFGYAKGIQAVSFVESIRKYYNTLIQLTHTDPVLDPPEPEPLRLVEIDPMAL